MANIIEFVVKGRNQSGPAVQSATLQQQQLAKSMKTVGDIASGIMTSQIFNAMARGAQQAFSSTVRAASDLNESMNAVSVVFGDSAEQVLQWGQDNAAAFGLSRRAFNQSITPMGALLKNTGLDMDVVTSSSLQLAQRAADMASVFNTDVQQALQAIQAALRGEADPIEKFGVSMKAAAVEARALADSGKESVSALTEQDLALARVAIVLEQTSALQGDFARTSDEAANASRIARARFEDAQATLGEKLLPVLAQVASAAAAVAGMFEAMPEPLRNVLTVVGLLAAGFLVLAPRLIAAKVAMDRLAASSKAFALSAGGVVTALAALLTLMASFKQETVGSQIEVSQLAEDLMRFEKTGRVTGELWSLFGENVGFFKDKLAEADTQIGRADDGFTKFVESIGLGLASVEDARDRFKALDEGLAEHVEAGGDAVAIWEQLIETYKLSAAEQETLRALLPKFSEEIERAANRTRDEAEAHTSAADAAFEQIAALEELEDVLKAQADPMFKLIKAQQDLKEKQQEYTEAVRDHGRESPAAREALLILAEASVKLSGAVSGASEAFNGRLSPSMRATLKAAGLTEKQIKDIEKAFRSAAKAGESWEKDYTATATVNYQTTGTPPPPTFGFGPGQFSASGGIVGGLGPQPMQAGGIAGKRAVMVGEQRPEVLDVPVGTRVVPSVEQAVAQGLLPSVGGQVDVRNLAQEVAERVAREVARELALVIGRALDGARLVLDDRGHGRLEALTAGYYTRGG
jgi:hypothetical protein